MLGYLSNVSPLKVSGKRKYFNYNIHTKLQTRKGAFFTPNKRQELTNFQNNKSPVKIQNFHIYTEASNDLVLDKDSRVSVTELMEEDQFTPVIVSSDTLTTLESLNNATADQFVTIKAKVHSLSATKKIVTKKRPSTSKKEFYLIQQHKSK